MIQSGSSNFRFQELEQQGAILEGEQLQEALHNLNCASEEEVSEDQLRYMGLEWNCLVRRCQDTVVQKGEKSAGAFLLYIYIYYRKEIAELTEELQHCHHRKDVLVHQRNKLRYFPEFRKYFRIVGL